MPLAGAFGRMREMRAKCFVLALVLVNTAAPAAAAVPQTNATRSPIRYAVSFPRPETHYMEVTAEVPTSGRSSIEMMMAVWTPGSYLIREYERHVEAVRAAAGERPLTVEKSAKNRWRVQTGGASSVTVSYRVYAHESSTSSCDGNEDLGLVDQPAWEPPGALWWALGSGAVVVAGLIWLPRRGRAR